MAESVESLTDLDTMKNHYDSNADKDDWRRGEESSIKNKNCSHGEQHGHKYVNTIHMTVIT